MVWQYLPGFAVSRDVEVGEYFLLLLPHPWPMFYENCFRVCF